MSKAGSTHDLANYYDQLYNHTVGISLYTPLCLFFPFPDSFQKEQVVEKLENGLKRLFSSFPWLASQVVRHSSANRPNGHLVLAQLERENVLITKDLSTDSTVPSMGDYETERFPSRTIPGDVFFPLEGIPNAKVGDAAPVLVAQANFIKGGLVLSLAGEHSAVDGQGFGQVVHLLSKACHGEDFTAEEVLAGNRAKGNLIPLLDTNSYQPGPEMDYLLAKPAPAPATSSPAQSPPTCSWATVHFSSSSLAGLKKLASASSSISDKPSVPYVTSNDALSAFIWQCTTRARSARLLPDETTSVFGRAVDCRSALSLSPSYLGNMSNHAYTKLPVSTLLSASLASLASTLRSDLKPDAIAYGIRSIATHIQVAEDVSNIRSGANMNFSHDLFFSSWARLPTYGDDFNLGLGLPKAVRRPGFLAIEGLMYLLPMDTQGGIDALISLRNEDLELLKADKAFGQYATWVG